MPDHDSPGGDGVGVHPLLDRAAAYSWRLLVVGAVVVATVLLLGQLLVIVVPISVAALVTRALWPVRAALDRRGAKPALSASVALLVLLIGVVAVLGGVGAAFAGQADELWTTVNEGVDDITNWLVDDSPFDISQADLDEWRDTAGDRLQEFLAGQGDSILKGASTLGEIVIGFLLMLIVTFFMLKDGERLRDRWLAWVRPTKRSAASAAAARGWSAGGGYLQGAAVLGIVEGIAIGVTLWLVGGALVVPVMVLTFLLAFVPIVGAVVAGIIAVLVALVTAGNVGALIVAIVVIVVQQLDNDLLAPVIYGKSLRLHPLVILLGITAGGALFGIVGTLLAVPVLAVGINAVRGYRSGDSSDSGDAGDAGDAPAAYAGDSP